ncbi:hypothetical protein C3L33_05557, partial [Rhododendron williamsianum]
MHSVSFTIFPNLTLFRCVINNELSLETEKRFPNNNYTYYRGRSGSCHGYTVYYSYPNQPGDQVPTQGSIPENCVCFQLPMVSSVKGRDLSDPFSLLTPYLSVKYNLSAECRECLDDGGQCRRDSGEFQCKRRAYAFRICRVTFIELTTSFFPLTEAAGRKRLPLILGTVIAGVILLSCLHILIIRYRKKLRNYISSCTIWRNSSSNLYSKEDLEEGSAYFGIPVFSYSELKDATHNFDPSKELGDGGFGTVHYGKPYYRETTRWTGGCLYEHNYKRVAQFLNEIEILTNLRHPSLVTLYGCTSRHNRELLLVYEYIPNGTVADHIHEYHQCYQLTDKSDVYSFGVVLIELISSLLAVDFSRHRHEINLAKLAIDRIQNGAFNELIDSSLGFESDSSVERMTTSVAEVAFQCLQLERGMRPCMNKVLEALKGIQEYKDEEIGKMPPPSPDRDNVELLKSSKEPPSPKSVTDRWVSSSNTTISGE